MSTVDLASHVVSPKSRTRPLLQRLLVVLFLVASSASLEAQWTNEPNPTLPGRGGIGVPAHASARLRIADDAPGVVTFGPFQLAFGSTAAMWWAFRLDATNNLHLDRQGSSGWAEGVIFDRDGDLGIGTVSPSQILHATRDQNAGTVLQVSNASNGVVVLNQDGTVTFTPASNSRIRCITCFHFTCPLLRMSAWGPNSSVDRMRLRQHWNRLSPFELEWPE